MNDAPNPGYILLGALVIFATLLALYISRRKGGSAVTISTGIPDVNRIPQVPKCYDVLRARFHQCVSLIPEANVLKWSSVDSFPPFTPVEGSYILITKDNLSYIYRERGEDFNIRTTRELEELSYWIVSDFTRSVASEIELHGRRQGEDSRRQWMAIHVSLLRRCSDPWAEAKKKEYEAILHRHPFSDSLPARGIEEGKYKIG